MGTTIEATQELRRPRLHAGFELAMMTGMLGDKPGAGIERASAGGMHSLVIDEAGRVRALLNTNGGMLIAHVSSLSRSGPSE
jgi:alpha-tubulin suppressor-like RCC1 family protein